MKRKPIRFIYFASVISIIILIFVFLLIICSSFRHTFDLSVLILSISLISAWLGCLLLVGRWLYSTITITKEGVRASYFKTYFDARWEELIDIGIGSGPLGVGVNYTFIYFSKVQQHYYTPQQLAAIRPSQDFVKIELTQKVLDEVLKYVPLERIRGTNRSVLNRFKLPNQNR